MDLVLPVEDDRIWKPGERIIGKMSILPPALREKIKRWFVGFMAGIYGTELVKAIDSQRYGDVWSPLSLQYAMLKKEMGWSSNIWEATGKLKESISWWKVDKPVKGWAVGINPRAYYVKRDGSRLPVRTVAFWMEYGTGELAEKEGRHGWPGMPPRPLFRPLRERLSRDMSRWWSEFLEEFSDEVDEVIALAMIEGK